jgi:uncharacterized protein (DUF111 family)
MKLMYIDCSMGAAGDMLTAALLELLDEGARTAFIDEFNGLGIPGVVMQTEPCVKCGVEGTRVHILVHGAEEDGHMHDHGHAHHSHAHSHDGGATFHTHNGVAEIEHIVKDHLDVPENVKEDILKVYDIIADAESKAHGVPVTEIHFREVGTMDAIADVTAVCMLIDRLRPQKIKASHVNVGGGTVRCAHGILPVPAPATANILEGIPSYSGDIKSELCTPTGAALLKHFTDEFVDGTEGLPQMSEMHVGHGMGSKDFERANCVTIMLGEVYK